MRRCATSPVPAARKVDAVAGLNQVKGSEHRLARNKANFFFVADSLDLIIDDCTCVDPISCSAEADFSTERVPRAATAVRSVASMTVK
jgi:hypothetical protein